MYNNYCSDLQIMVRTLFCTGQSKYKLSKIHLLHLLLNETFIVTPRVIEIYMCKREILIDFIILTSNNGRNLMTKFCLVGDIGGKGSLTRDNCK